jgi:hypothetical protein
MAARPGTGRRSDRPGALLVDENEAGLWGPDQRARRQDDHAVSGHGLRPHTVACGAGLVVEMAELGRSILDGDATGFARVLVLGGEGHENSRNERHHPCGTTSPGGLP